MLLGPEAGWEAEEEFYETLMAKVKAGTSFWHMVSLEGIDRHLGRKHSEFPNVDTALSNLDHSTNNVAIQTGGKLSFFKKIPEDKGLADLKPDRQARVLMVERKDGQTEGVLVIDLGPTQTAFHLRGPLMSTYWDECIRFYDKCSYLSWKDIMTVLEKDRAKNGDEIGALTT